MKYALITGASRGIGRAIAGKLAEDGYCVLINYLSNASAAQTVKEEIESAGGSADLMRFDVSKTDECETAISQWQTSHKGEYIEALVNNAGLRRDGVMALMEKKDWDDVLTVTLDGFYNVTHALLPAMMKKRYGRIINMSSVSGLNGIPGQTNYSAAKAAIIGATKALSHEVAQRGITVNAVAPGFIETDMTEGLDKESLCKQIPCRRFGRPEEVADLVSFLASPKAAYITGEVISIGGGL